MRAVAMLAICCGALVSDRKPTHACAMAVARTVAMPLIDGEEALIVWDPTTQMEHFVRRANFGGARSVRVHRSDAVAAADARGERSCV